MAEWLGKLEIRPLDLFQVDSGSTPWLHLYISPLVCLLPVGILNLSSFFELLVSLWP